MWMLLPMVSLLIRAIIGNPQIDESTLSVIIGLGNESNNLVTDNRIEKSSNDIWKPLMGGESLRKIVSDRPKENNNVNIDQDRTRTSSNVKIASKRSEAEIGGGIWFELSTRNQGIRKVSQETASPWLYSWENRRPLALHGSSISCICRQLRLPSISKCIDKRKKDYSQSNVALQTKRTKLTYDGYGWDTAVDEFNGIKRVGKMRKVGSKTPFNSWGGKRAKEQSTDQEQFSQLSKDSNDRHFSNANKDESPAGKYAGEIVVQMRNGISAVYQNWNRKRNLYPNPIPFRIYNETDEHDYTNDEVNGIADWLSPIYDKKFEQHGQYKKTKFNPWGGKRSSKACAFRFRNNYFTTRAYAGTRPTGREYI